MPTWVSVALVLLVLFLALRVHHLETKVRKLEKPRRRDRAIRKEIRELEVELDALREQGVWTDDDFTRGDVIREQLDRRLRALAGPRFAPPPSPPPTGTA